jgi:hypothetical protein
MVFWLVLIFLIVILIATAKKTGKFGINLRRVKCPRCRAPMPVGRRPANAHQAFWGGWTCSCGCEVDKWGKEIKS